MKTRRLSIIALLAALLIPLCSQGVTKEEMEQAKVIAAKNYLRFENDGSGYLDNLPTPKTMAEFQKQLKPKEVENLKAVNSIVVPTDYATWDKEKFVKYWSETFYSSGSLTEKGKGGRTRTRNAVSKMNVTAPGNASAPADTVKKDVAAESRDTAKREEAPLSQLDPISLADGAEETAAVDSVPMEVPVQEEAKSSGGATWIYIGILVVLVAVVVWLIIMASKTMKENNARRRRDDDDDDDDDDEDEEELKNRKKYAPQPLAQTPGKEETEVAHNKMIEKLRKENDELRFTTANLQTEVAALNRRLQRVETERDNALSTLAAYNKQASERTELLVTPDDDEETPVVKKKSSAPRTIYLGRVNDEGVFVRADKEYNPKGSIYRFVTTDGISGSFYVIDSAETRHFISLNAKRMLAGGCTGVNFDDIDRIEEIQTLSPGTAVLDDKRFRMVRKARIEIQ